jgi:hypothetical protein
MREITQVGMVKHFPTSACGCSLFGSTVLSVSAEDLQAVLVDKQRIK